MEKLDRDNYERLSELTRKHNSVSLYNISPAILNEIALFRVYEYSDALFYWMRSIKVVIDPTIYQSKLEFNGRDLIFTTVQRGEGYDLRSRLSSTIEQLEEVFDHGKHPSNTTPYALESLFNNKSPHRNIEIRSHFQEGNYVLIETSSEKKWETKKTNKYKEIKHAFVIERWQKDGEVLYKTKSKDFFEELKQLKIAKVAPKVQIVEIKTINEQTYSSYDDLKIKANIVKKQENNVEYSYIEITDLHRFASDFILKENLVHKVVYNDGKYVVINFVNDKYGPDHSCNRKFLETKCFGINEYGGLQEFPIVPGKIKLQLPVEPELPEVHVRPLDTNQVKVMISEDETEVLDFPYTYIKATIEHESHRARVYNIVNMFNGKKKKQYMAKYGDCWVNTDEHNPRIKELYEVLEFCDILTKDWDQIPI